MRAFIFRFDVFGNPPRRRQGLHCCVQLAGDPSCVWQELLDTERNAKCRKARVWYSCGTGDLDHLVSTGWLLEARLRRTSHCQSILELPVWRAKYSRKGSTTILPAASMLVPLMSPLMVDAIFWFTRQTARVNGGWSRNDSFRASTLFDSYICTGASATTDTVTSTSMKSTMNTALDLPLVAQVANRPLLQAMFLFLFECALRTCIFVSLSERQSEDLTNYATRDALNSATPRNTSWSWRTECTQSRASQDVANANSVASFGEP